MAASTLLFNGGTLRARQDNTSFITGVGAMAMVIADDTNAVFDTNGKTVIVNPQGSPYDTVLTLRGADGASASGNGGLTKIGAGALVLRLPAACNTFTGAVTVTQGTLDLGRPLATNQTATVSAGANVVLHSPNDLDKITFLDGGTGARMLYTVAVDTDTLDLSVLDSLYYDDRLAGPYAGTFTLSNTVTHSAGTLETPFRLIGQGGTLNLANTTLETQALQVEGTGTFNFMGSRTFASADAGMIAITDGVTLTDGMLQVGGGTGFVGGFSQSTGTVTLSSAAYVGLNGGTGDLTLTGGQFIVGGILYRAHGRSVEVVDS